METNLNLEQTIASFFNVALSQISVDGIRATIAVDDDAAVTAITSQWHDATYVFENRLRYIVIQRGEYKRELPLNRWIWESGQLVK